MNLTLLLKLFLLCLQLIQQAVERNDRDKHEKEIADIKADPRAAFMRKFGRVRADAVVQPTDTSANVPASGAESNDSGK